MLLAQYKTAPALLDEVLSYSEKGCQHDYKLNRARSTFPSQDERPDTSTEWQVSAVCFRCRCHLDLKIGFSQSEFPCPNSNFPLHHFIPTGSSNRDGRFVARYGCSAQYCRATLVLNIQSAILQPADIALLTDRNALKVRFKTTKESHATAEEITPKQALETFRSYVRDSVDNSSEAKRIPAKNKRFMGALGEDARDLLIRLGFRYSPPTGDPPMGYWHLPRPVDETRGIDEPFQSMLADVGDEVNALIEFIVSADQNLPKEDSLRTEVLAVREMERLLGTLSCR